VAPAALPGDWRASDGLRIGEGFDRVRALDKPSGDVVYGFGLSRPAEPVCR
jgi:hypothetical protein